MDFDTWPLVRAYAASCRSRSAVARKSYSELLSANIAMILSSQPPLKWRGEDVRVGGPDGSAISFRAPTHPPATCRLLDQTYEIVVVANITGSSGDKIIAKDARLFSIPLMVGCSPCATYGASPSTLRAINECPSDAGGYFIIEGKEKAVAGVVEASVSAITHKVIKSRKSASAHFGKTSGEVHVVSAFAGACTISAPAHLRRGYPVLALSLSAPGGRVVQVPVVTAIRALGPATDRDIVLAVTAASCGAMEFKAAHEVLRPSLEHSAGDGPLQTTALTMISSATASNGALGALRMVRACVPGSQDDSERAMSLAYVASQCVLAILGRPGQVVDRDSYEAKAIASPGIFVARAIEARWGLHVAQAAADLVSRDLADLPDDALKHAMHDREMRDTLAKVFRSSDQKSPVFDMPRYTSQGASAYVSRIINPVNASEIDARGPHGVHPTQFGFVCPVETPEGKQVGLTCALACMATVTGWDASLPKSQQAIRRELGRAGMHTDTLAVSSPRSVPVLMDGAWVGSVDKPSRICAALRSQRHAGVLDKDVSVSWKLGCPVHIRTSPGRLSRPLIICESVKATKSVKSSLHEQGDWEALLRPAEGMRTPLLEYVDVAESACALTATTPRDVVDGDASTPAYTHIEVHQTAALSHVAATIPFSDRNAAPRNVFASKQVKSCASVHASTYRSRLDTSTHVLHAGQRPLVDTAWSDINGMRDLPFGVNAMVAIASFTGYNQEDAIIINAGSVERGMFASTHLHTLVKDENVRDGGAFCNPSSKAIESRASTYAGLDPSGLPIVGSAVSEGGAIVGHVTGNDRDTSLVCDLTVHGTVAHAVMFDKGGRIGRRVKVCLYESRQPKVGDKFASRHGQKGICATLMPSHEMMHMEDGTVPDMIINPHALPSRMTIGQVLEGILSKTACFSGTVCVDATNSCAPTCSGAMNALSRHAEMTGSEVMFDPRTGRMQECTVTFAPTFYLRLVHMVADKIGISRNGKTRRDVRTGQPVRGRAEAGALRIGEMETNAILAHGASLFLRDAFTSGSDGQTVPGAALSDGRVCVPDSDNGTIPLRDKGWLTERTLIHRTRLPRSFSLFQAEVAGSTSVAMDALPADTLDAEAGASLSHIDTDDENV